MAYTNLLARVGAQGTTNAKGFVALKFATAGVQLDALPVYGPAGYWGLYQKQIRIKNGKAFSLQRVNLATPDYVATPYAGLPMSAGTKVKVGVIDTGIDDTNPDLRVAVAESRPPRCEPREDRIVVVIVTPGNNQHGCRCSHDVLPHL